MLATFLSAAAPQVYLKSDTSPESAECSLTSGYIWFGFNASKRWDSHIGGGTIPLPWSSTMVSAMEREPTTQHFRPKNLVPNE